MFSYICFCQILIIVTRNNVAYLETILVQLDCYRFIANISILLSTIWNLEFFLPFVSVINLKILMYCSSII